MKRILLLLILVSVRLSAQDWSPINLSDKYNYRLDADGVITQTIWQKNYSVNGSDTTFNFNTTYCDTCVIIVGGPNLCDTCYGQRNLPRFLGYSLVKIATGTCNFRNPGSKTILLHAVMNDTWLFDTLNAVTAQVVFNGNATVLGNSDSVKTVLLSTGDTVQFSKNYGITIWPNGYGQNSYFKLAGIHGRNIGELMPRTADYFDFQIGDMFEYISQAQDCAATSHIHTLKRKYTITSKVVNGDTTTYHASGLSRDDVTNFQTNWVYYYPVNYDIVVVDSVDHLGNNFNGEIISDDNRIMALWCNSPPYVGNVSGGGGEKLAGTHLFQDSLGIISFGMGINYDCNLYDLNSINGCFDTIAPYHDTLDPNTPVYYLALMKKGLGQVTGYYNAHFEGFYYEHLEAYRKGNDTVGVFTPDFLLDGLNESANAQLGINVFPNPSVGCITVEIPENTLVDIAITDLQGRELRRFNALQGRSTLHLEDFANGVYVLSAVSSNGVYQQKITVSH